MSERSNITVKPKERADQLPHEAESSAFLSHVWARLCEIFDQTCLILCSLPCKVNLLSKVVNTCEGTTLFTASCDEAVGSSLFLPLWMA